MYKELTTLTWAYVQTRERREKGVHNIAFLGSLHFRKDLTHFLAPNLWQSICSPGRGYVVNVC